MSRAKRNIIPILNKVKERMGRPIVIVETGTIRNTKGIYLEGDGHSTKFIAQWVKENGGEFHSVDLDISVAAKYMIYLGLLKYVTLHRKNSLTFLRQIGQVDVAYLDSANDADQIFNEFELIYPKVNKGGAIIIDDVIPGSVEVVKGHKVLPHIRELGLKHRLQENQCLIEL